MKSTFLKTARELRAVWMLLIVSVVLFIATPLFLTGSNLLNVLLATSVTALLAAGQTFVI
ncbi:MAG: ribose transport system permease protein, partial [Alpinimonas sp.]